MARHVFLHIGDTHLHDGPRNGDREDALQQIIARARELSAAHELAAILWPGDFFHQKSSPVDRNILASVLSALAQLAPVVGCYGNHDVPGDLDVFTKLSAPWPITIVSLPQVLRLRSATKLPVAIFCLPYPHRAGLVSAGAAHAAIGQMSENLLDPIFLTGAQQLVEAYGDGYVPLTIGHVNVGGSVVSTGQPNIGVEIELTPALLDRLPSGPVALNHIHKHQRLQERAIYAGSIARMDFGEMEAKGFVEYTFDDQASQAQWSWRFVPLDVPQQFDVTGELTRDGFVFDLPCATCNGQGWIVESEHHPSCQGDCQHCPVEAQVACWCRDFRGADVRCRYRYLKADAGVIDVEHIKKLFAGCRSLKLEGQPQLTHEMRAPEIAAAVTLEEKVAKYCELHKIIATAGLRDKLTALQSSPPEAVISSLTASLSTVGAVPAEQVVA